MGRTTGRLMATQQIKDRIAELNAQQGWVVDLDEDRNQQNYFIVYKHSIRKNLHTASTCVYQYLPIEFYGSKETIETVIKELEPQIKLWLGV